MRADDGSACAYVCVCIKRCGVCSQKEREEKSVCGESNGERVREKDSGRGSAVENSCACVCVLCASARRESCWARVKQAPPEVTPCGLPGVGGTGWPLGLGVVRARVAWRVAGPWRCGGDPARPRRRPLVEYV